MQTSVEKFVPDSHSLSLSRYYRFWSLFVGRLNDVLRFFGMRKRRKFWGVVYDSVNKQPLDPVLINLVYVDSTHAVQTGVTDLSGRYGFLARPGKFKILVRKTNYSFPSTIVSASNDGVYDHLYHGEFIELTGGTEVVAPNIPMDPVAKDWNQQAKKHMVDNNPYVKLLRSRLIQSLFWFIFALAGVNLIFTYPSHSVSWVAILLVYAWLLGANVLLPHERLWGLVTTADPVNLEHLILELHNPLFPDVILGKTEVGQDGKFFLLANPGYYTLVAKYKQPNQPARTAANTQVKVGKIGVVNQSLDLLK